MSHHPTVGAPVGLVHWFGGDHERRIRSHLHQGGEWGPLDIGRGLSGGRGPRSDRSGSGDSPVPGPLLSQLLNPGSAPPPTSEERTSCFMGVLPPTGDGFRMFPSSGKVGSGVQSGLVVGVYGWLEGERYRLVGVFVREVAVV